jgi:hypothetical protein
LATVAAGQGHAGYIAARPVQARDDTKRHGITADDEDNGNSRSSCFGGADRRSASCGDNYRYSSADEVGRQCGQPIILTVCIAVLERHIPAFRIAGFAQPFVESSEKMWELCSRCSIEISDQRHRWRLLRARRERPRRGGTAGKCDKFPSPHGFARAEDYIGYEKNITFLNLQ